MKFEIIKEIKESKYVGKDKKEHIWKDVSYYLFNKDENLKIQIEPHSWIYKDEKGQQRSNSNRETINTFVVSITELKDSK